MLANPPSVRPWMLVSVLGLCALSVHAAPAGAADPLHQSMRALAGQVRDLMHKERIDCIAVGDFTGKQGLHSNAGSRIKDTLAKELHALGVTVKSPAYYEVKGDYRPFDDQASSLTCVRVTASIYDDNGIVSSFKLEACLVTGNTALCTLAGVTAKLDPAGNDRAHNVQLKEAIHVPACHVAGSKVSATPDCLYAMEVLVKRGGQRVPRPAQDVGSYAYVGLAADDVYVLRLYNQTDHEAAAQVAIDGLSMFHFSKVLTDSGEPFRSVFIPPRGTTDVEGWFVTLDDADEFRVAPLSSSPIASLRSPGNLGVITVAFGTTRPKTKIPIDGVRAPIKVTDRGERIKVQYVETQRKFDALRAAVSIRYNK